MITLLQINASLNGNGQSSQLANQFVTAFQQNHPGTKIIKRDVAVSDPVPHLDNERFGAFIYQAHGPSPAGVPCLQLYLRWLDPRRRHVQNR
jgi:FMN-dependent NADH-azoreductase